MSYIFLKRLKNSMDGNFVDPYVEQRIQYINELYNLSVAKARAKTQQLDDVRTHIDKPLSRDLGDPELLND